ncbi:methyltransferase-like protein 27 [Oratosquilla oratoria]|uniref:methyltransferase-like protein 27 n=1 Tax=Oratosquilla oratoria TaxID=337810 RepID=UPI003F776D66
MHSLRKDSTGNTPNAKTNITKMIEGRNLKPYIMNGKEFEPCQSKEDVIQRYDNWASAYDDDMVVERLEAPQAAAEYIKAYVPQEERVRARVLDLAAGTGRMGKELYKRGFRNFDALDPSKEMMKILEKTGLYTNKVVEFLGKEETSLPSNTYDVVVIVGGLLDGHAPVDSLIEMVRVARPGALICIAMREIYLEGLREFTHHYQPLEDKLEQERKWVKLERKRFPNYYRGEFGVLFPYKVL